MRGALFPSNKLALAESVPNVRGVKAELGRWVDGTLTSPPNGDRELYWLYTVNGRGTLFGPPGPNLLVVDPNPTVGLGSFTGLAFALVLAVCRLSDETVRLREGLSLRETVTGPRLDDVMENPGEGVLAVAYRGGGTSCLGSLAVRVVLTNFTPGDGFCRSRCKGSSVLKFNDGLLGTESCENSLLLISSGVCTRGAVCSGCADSLTLGAGGLRSLLKRLSTSKWYVVVA